MQGMYVGPIYQNIKNIWKSMYRVRQSNPTIWKNRKKNCYYFFAKQIKSTQVEFYVIYLKTSFFKDCVMPFLVSHTLWEHDSEASHDAFTANAHCSLDQCSMINKFRVFKSDKNIPDNSTTLATPISSCLNRRVWLPHHVLIGYRDYTVRRIEWLLLYNNSISVGISFR